MKDCVLKGLLPQGSFEVHISGDVTVEAIGDVIRLLEVQASVLEGDDLPTAGDVRGILAGIAQKGEQP